MSHGDLKYTDL